MKFISVERQALFDGYIENWKEHEMAFELEKIKDIQGILKADTRERLTKECGNILDQILELSWKVWYKDI
jgi:hypothetical protein